ncbi:Piwi-like protein 1, partial [Orchesella cincta]
LRKPQSTEYTYMTLVSSARRLGNSVRKAFRSAIHRVSKMTGRGGDYRPQRGHLPNPVEADPDVLALRMASLGTGPQREEAPEQREARGSPQYSAKLPPTGREIHLISNHFELRWVGKSPAGEDGFLVHQYFIQFQPDPTFIFGSEIFTVKRLETQTLESRPDSPVKWRADLTYTKAVPKDNPVYMQIYNLVVRKCLFGMGLDEIGRSYFDTAAVIDHPNLKIQLWPGYATAVKQCEKGLLLCVDVTHKVIRNDDLLTHIRNLMQLHRSTDSTTLEEFILENIKGSMIITPYNKKTYRVDGILLDDNPLSTFAKKDGTVVSYVSYMKERYDAHISDLTQPLVVVAEAKRNLGKRADQWSPILVPEMCLMTGLTEAMRANMGIMKTLNKHLHMEPKERVEILQQFISKLSGTPRCKETLNTWGFAFELKLKGCSIGRVLLPETIVFSEQRTVRVDNNNDFTKALRSNQLLTCVPLEKWIVVVPVRDLQNAKDFSMTMHKVATPLGFRIRKPVCYETVPDTRVPNYMRSLEDIIAKQPSGSLQMILCILPNNKSELYYAIKKRLSQDLGKCVEQFSKANHATPDFVIFYRANIEEGIISSGTAAKEAKKIEDALAKSFKPEAAKDHGFVYIGVTKQHNVRLLTHKGNCSEERRIGAAQVMNPPPGTILDHDIVAAEKTFPEFFLVPTNARQGQFASLLRVIRDSHGFSPQVIQAYTYKMCHLYYNWSGAVNLPSTCQYAGKLAKQAAYSMPSHPHSSLCTYLHYL